MVRDMVKKLGRGKLYISCKTKNKKKNIGCKDDRIYENLWIIPL